MFVLQFLSLSFFSVTCCFCHSSFNSFLFSFLYQTSLINENSHTRKSRKLTRTSLTLLENFRFFTAKISFFLLEKRSPDRKIIFCTSDLLKFSLAPLSLHFFHFVVSMITCTFETLVETFRSFFFFFRSPWQTQNTFILNK